MGHTPLGYRIENGIAVIDEEAEANHRNAGFHKRPVFRPYSIR